MDPILQDFEKQVDEHRLSKLRELVDAYNSLPIDEIVSYPDNYTPIHLITRRCTDSTIEIDSNDKDPVVYIFALWLQYIDIPEVLTFDSVCNKIFKRYLSKMHVFRKSKDIRKLGLYQVITNSSGLKVFAYSMINYEKLLHSDPSSHILNRVLEMCGYHKIESTPLAPDSYRRIVFSRINDPRVDGIRLAAFLVELYNETYNVVRIQDYYDFMDMLYSVKY